MNTIPAVFDSSHSKHQDFKPVLDWLISGKGKFVYGGKTYKDELGKLGRYLKIIVQLEKKGKVVNCDDTKVDTKEQLIKDYLLSKKISPNDKRYNDAHIVAIVAESKVKIVSSLDMSSYAFLRQSVHYVSSKHRPIIYTRKENKKILNDGRNFGRCCE